MKLDWNRIKRTFIQSASGGAIALITAITADADRTAVISALVGFVSTVAIAVLMNIQTQADEMEEVYSEEEQDEQQ